ncbi:MAG: hypothetical protein SFU25_06855 [Candidatus Caenarcaniphilales bacterium]|nr:hypothetical protein [Candidatus Caenarcaniphilales bacterium]
MIKRLFKVEKVGDINSDYPYLEVFSENCLNPFLEISISSEKKVIFKFYASSDEIFLTYEEVQQLLDKSKVLLESSLNNENFIKDYF